MRRRVGERANAAEGREPEARRLEAIAGRGVGQGSAREIASVAAARRRRRRRPADLGPGEPRVSVGVETIAAATPFALRSSTSAAHSTGWFAASSGNLNVQQQGRNGHVPRALPLPTRVHVPASQNEQILGRFRNAVPRLALLASMDRAKLKSSRDGSSWRSATLPAAVPSSSARRCCA